MGSGAGVVMGRGGGCGGVAHTLGDAGEGSRDSVGVGTLGGAGAGTLGGDGVCRVGVAGAGEETGDGRQAAKMSRRPAMASSWVVCWMVVSSLRAEVRKLIAWVTRSSAVRAGWVR